MFRYLPEQGSDFAADVDWIHNLVTDLSVFFTVAITGTMIYFALKYRRRNGVDHETPHIEGSLFLEVMWTVIPSIICVIVAAYGYIAFDKTRAVPTDALEINVTGHQWWWDFVYPNGKKTKDEFTVPVGKAVKLVLTSGDVIHSLYVPEMRIKRDAVPGQYNYQWFRPIKTGESQVFCTEYCGTNHSGMLAKLNVVSQDQYDQWVNDKSEEIKAGNGPKLSPAKLGEKLYSEKACVGCHSLDGSKRVGPSWLQLFGRKEKISDGTVVTVDENYIRESILVPGAKIVEGYANQMPSFQGQLNDEQIGGIIAFIKTLDGKQPVAAAQPKAAANLTPVEHGKQLYQEKTCSGCHSLDGSKLVGPSWKGIYMRKGKLQDGSDYVADDAYIKRSIYKPQDQIVEGYPPSMPAIFEGQLSDKDVADIIEFMKTLK